MKISNKTKYNTIALKKIFSKCLSEVKKTDSSPYFKKLMVYIINHSRSYIGGYAYHNSGTLAMKMPSLEKLQTRYNEQSDFDMSQKVADTFIHEIGHCLGVKHNRNGDTFEQHFKDWIKKTIDIQRYPIFYNEPKVFSVADSRNRKYQHAVVKLKQSQTKLKRAENLVKKWRNKVKYYQSKI